MKEIPSRIYYAVSTGEVLLVTSEMLDVDTAEIKTKEQDIETYLELKDKKSEEIDYIELEYGTVSSTYNNMKSQRVNIETKKLEVIYYTKEELQTKEETQNLNSRVSDIATYLNNNSTTISDIEDLILKSEQNRITNGGM